MEQAVSDNKSDAAETSALQGLERERAAYREMRAPPGLAARVVASAHAPRRSRRARSLLLVGGSLAAAASVLLVLSLVAQSPAPERVRTWRSTVPSLTAVHPGLGTLPGNISTRVPTLTGIARVRARVPPLRTPRSRPLVAPQEDVQGDAGLQRFAEAVQVSLPI